jgi:hypothetical protein
MRDQFCRACGVSVRLHVSSDRNETVARCKFLESWQQSLSSHFFEWLGITLIPFWCQDNDAPHVKRIVTRAADGVLDVKKRLKVACP